MSVLQRILFYGDIHAPYHDTKAFELALKASRAFKPDIVVIMGDLLDAYSVSAHDKDPSRKNNLDWEIGIARECLDQIAAAAKGAKKYFIEGNHCTRVSRYIAKHCPQLVDLIKVPDLLQLKEKGYHFTPYKKSLKIGKLYVTHDIGKAGPTAHLSAANHYGGNVVIGHVHSAGISYSGSVNGDRHVGMSVGWLGDLESVDYMHADVARKNWTHGIGLGYLETNGTAHLSFAPFINGRVVIEGKIVELRESVRKLRIAA